MKIILGTVFYLVTFGFSIFAQPDVKKIEKLCEENKYDNPEQAIEYCTELIKLQPNSMGPYYDRAIAYNRFVDINNLRTPEGRKAFAEKMRKKEDDYAKAVELDPQNSEKLYALGNHQLKYRPDSELDSAIETFKKLLEINPKDLDARTKLATAYRKFKKPDDSEETVNQRKKKAIEEFDKVIAENDKLAEAYRGRGIARFELGDYNAARDFGEAKSLSAKQGMRYPIDLYYIAKIEFIDGNYESASMFLSTAMLWMNQDNTDDCYETALKMSIVTAQTEALKKLGRKDADEYFRKKKPECK